MLERAVSLKVGQSGDALAVRLVNETGHKLPTGHIEGRRVWLNVRFLDAGGGLVGEHGHYDEAEAELDEASTAVYEMHVGLSEDAARATGLPAGPTTHMAIADTIELDNRIPPRGFDNAAFSAAGAPAVGYDYADGQYWDDRQFPIPEGAATAEVTAYYQNTPRHYIEALRDANHTDHWGDTLHELWTATGRGAPIAMASRSTVLCPSERRTAAGDQTKKTQIRSAGKGSGDQLLTKGVFSLPAGEAFSPDEAEVAVQIRDGSGVHYETVLPASTFARSADGRKFLFKDKTGGTNGLQLAKLILVGEGQDRVKYVIKAKGLDHSDFVAGVGGATIRVGERCFVDDADLCTARPGGAQCK
jgi:hypothetical protein